MGTGSSLPVTGGIVRRPQIDSVPKPKQSKRYLQNGMTHPSEEYKINTDIKVAA
jgi:hypothetical protein